MSCDGEHSLSVDPASTASIMQTWEVHAQNLSAPDALQQDELMNIWGFITREFPKRSDLWFPLLLRSLNGLELLFLLSSSLQLGKSMCLEIPMAMREVFFYPERFSESCLLFKALVNYSSQVAAHCCQAIAEFVELPDPNDVNMGNDSNSEEAKFPQFPAKLLQYDNFSDDFDWFRYLLSKSPAFQPYFQSLDADLGASISIPFLPKLSDSLPSAQITPFTIDSITKNVLVNSYTEHMYHKTPPPSSQQRPLYIQFDDYSATEHPVLKVSPHNFPWDNDSMHNLVYFFFTFVLFDPASFHELTQRLTSTSTQSLHNQLYESISANLNQLLQILSTASFGLNYQLQIFNYRLYTLQLATKSTPPSITPLPPPSPTASYEDYSFFDPIRFTLPRDRTHTPSHTFTNWNRAHFGGFRVKLTSFLQHLEPVSGTFFNAWALQHVYLRCHALNQFTITHQHKKPQRAFILQFITNSFNQYSQHEPTLYQHLHRLSLDIDTTSTNTKTRCQCFLSFILYAPFVLFPNQPAIIQKHILLCLHSSFVNTNPNTTSLPHNNNLITNVPQINQLNRATLHRITTPFSAVVYTWLTLKSGLLTHFRSPISEGASNLFWHAIDKRYCCNTSSNYAEHLLTISSIDFPNFSTPNAINILPTSNPLVERTNASDGQLAALVADTDGEIWFARYKAAKKAPSQTMLVESDDLMSESSVLVPGMMHGMVEADIKPDISKYPDFLEHTNRTPQWAERVTIYEFNDPFAHTTARDLFYQSRDNLLHENFDFNFFSTHVVDAVSEVIIKAGETDHSNHIPPWTDAHAEQLRTWLTNNRTALVEYVANKTLPTRELNEIHPRIGFYIMFYSIATFVNFNRSTNFHRFQNPTNMTECKLVHSEDNQALLHTPCMIDLKKQYRSYLNDLSCAEATLVKDVMKTVLLNADAAGLLSDQQVDTDKRCYPFPDPTPLPDSLPSGYLVSDTIPTDPIALDYQRNVSKWCIEMLLVSSLHLHSYDRIPDFDVQTTLTRPQRESYNPSQSSDCLTALISKATNYLMNGQQHQRFLSSMRLDPIPPDWLLGLNSSTDPWFMFDSFLFHLTNISLKSYETLLSLAPGE